MRSTIVLTATLAALAVGCSESPAPSRQATGVAQKATTTAPSGDRAIAGAAERFLRAILAGDSKTASQWLTAAATKHVATDPSLLSSVGMRVEKLQIAEVRRLSPDEAAVACLVSEPDSAAPVELGCLLKRDPAEWRVCGLASEAGADGPTVISFEGPLEAPVVPSRLVEGPNSDGETPRTAAGADPAPLR